MNYKFTIQSKTRNLIKKLIMIKIKLENNQNLILNTSSINIILTQFLEIYQDDNMQKQNIKTKIRQTGTTTVGLVCKDCVILAAETKSTLGSMISSKEAQKIYPVDDKIAVTISGAVGDAQALIRILSAEINIYKLTRSSEITVKAATTLLSNLMNSYRYYPYIAMLIIGGADKNGYHVYSIDPFGGVEEEKVT